MIFGSFGTVCGVIPENMVFGRIVSKFKMVAVIMAEWIKKKTSSFTANLELP